MKEQRIIAFIGIQTSVILASVTNSKTLSILWMALAVIYLFRYIYFTKK